MHKQEDTASNRRHISSNSSNSITPIVPIQTELAEQEILRRAADRSEPEDEYDNHLFLSRLQHVGSGPIDTVGQIVDAMMPNLIGGRRGSRIEIMRDHVQQFVLNIGRAILCNNWIATPRDKEAYTKGKGYMSPHGFSYTAIHDILDYLDEEGLVTCKDGKVFQAGGKVTRIFPSAKFQAELASLALYTQHEFHGSYLSFSAKTSEYRPLVAKLGNDHPDIKAMAIINEHLESQHWALKGPVVLRYQSDPFSGGRLYTPYQNLPSREYNIRKATLLNGQRISEVDYSANHLRLNLAVLSSQDAGDTPYEDIMEILGDGYDRQLVKDFITRSMGSDNRSKAMKAMYKLRVNDRMFNDLELATLRRYPKLSLYSGFGVHAQSLEGAILRDVMLAGIDQGITSLPVHDALAVQERDANWAEIAMLEYWQWHTGDSKAGARVSR